MEQAGGTAGRAPFLGRSPELDQALQAYVGSPRQASAVLVVAGEPGSGRTRFLRELGRSLALFTSSVLRETPESFRLDSVVRRLAEGGTGGERKPALLLDGFDDLAPCRAVLAGLPPGRSLFAAVALDGKDVEPLEEAASSRLRLGPLKTADLAAAVQERLDAAALSPEDLHLLLRVAGGLPAVALGAAEALLNRTGSGAGRPSLALPLACGPSGARAFAGRVARCKERGPAVAAAVLDACAREEDVLRLAGLRRKAGRDVLDRLEGEGLLLRRGEHLFLPVKGAGRRLLGLLGPKEMASLHRDAARILRRNRAPGSSVAVHLLRSDQAGQALKLLAGPVPEETLPGLVEALEDALAAEHRGGPAAALAAPLGQALLRLGRIEEAQAALDRALRDGRWTREERAPLQVSAADVRLARGDPRGAMEALAGSGWERSQDPRLLLAAGEALIGLGRFDRARDLLGTVLVRPGLALPHTASCHFLLGRAALALGEEPVATANFARAEAAAREAGLARLAGRTHVGRTHAALAVEDFAAAGRALLAARETEARQSVGLALEIDLATGLHAALSGDGARGVAVLRRAFGRSDPASIQRLDLLHALGLAHAARGRLRKAARFLRRVDQALAARGAEGERVSLALSRVLLALRRRAPAAAGGARALLAGREEPLFRAAAAGLDALESLDQGEWEEALQGVDQALALLSPPVTCPPLRTVLLRLASAAHLALGHEMEGRASLKEALALLAGQPASALEAAVDFAQEAASSPPASQDLATWARTAVEKARSALVEPEDEILAVRAERALAALASPPSTRPQPTGEAAGAREKKLLVLQSITRRINQEPDYDILLDTILDMALSVVGGQRGFILQARDDGQPVVARNMGDPVGTAGDDPGLALARGVIATGEPVIEAGAHRAQPTGSVICVPLPGRSGVLGAVYAEDSRRSGSFDPDDLWFLTLFADQAAVALENARLRRENERRRQELDRLNRQLSETVQVQDRSLAALADEVARARELRPARYAEIVGAAPAMLEVFRLLDKFVPTEAPVLIAGRSGTGKELVARAIHYHGPRKDRTFAAENCGALTETLLASELFGHEKGAFTGAHRAKQGLFEVADGGTLFLDEVAEMSPGLQAKLLRVLQEGEIRRVGGKKTIPVDVRILSATNRDLAEMVADGAFREDLYYRLNVLRIDLPTLAQRREDIPLLVKHFLDRLGRDGTERALSAEALDALCRHDWPGNVRELENEVLRAAALAGDEVGIEDLSPRLREAGTGAETDLDLKARVADLERTLLRQALDRTGGNKSQAARLLGISRYGLLKKLDRLGLGED